MSNTNAKGFIPATVIIVISSILFMIMTVVAEATETETGECTLSITSTSAADWENSALVTRVDGEDPQIWAIGDTAEFGPYTKDTTVEYRVFGGPERSFDDPQWTGVENGDIKDPAVLAIIIEHEEESGEPWEATDNADFVNWYKKDVEACTFDALPQTGASDYVGQIVLGTVALLVIGFGLIRLRRYWMEC